MDDLYQEHILEHYQHPRKKGELVGASCAGEAHNLSCGDQLSVQLRVDAAGIVQDVAWSGQGCAISQAAASILAEQLPGKSLKQFQALSLAEVSRELGLDISPARAKCAMLFVNALVRCEQ